MSNIGKKPLFLSKRIQLSHYKNFLIIKGVFGIIKIKINLFLDLNYQKDAINLKPLTSSLINTKQFKALWGTFRTFLENSIQGVYKSHFLKLKFVGVGYKAILKKNYLIYRLGYSHKMFNTIPKELVIKKIKKRPPTFFIKSFDLDILQKTVFLMRSFKKPEPYKGKGIVLLNEFIKLKECKKSRK